MEPMVERSVTNALEGLYAYDTGSVDSGIRDEQLRQRVYDAIRIMPPKVRRAWVCQFVCQHYLDDEAQQRGYGPDDALEFLRWLRDELPEAVVYTYEETR